MRRHLRFPPALIVPSAALIIPLPANAFPNAFPNILAANIPNKIEKGPPFFSFVSVLIVSQILYK